MVLGQVVLMDNKQDHIPQIQQIVQEHLRLIAFKEHAQSLARLPMVHGEPVLRVFKQDYTPQVQ